MCFALLPLTRKYGEYSSSFCDVWFRSVTGSPQVFLGLWSFDTLTIASWSVVIETRDEGNVGQDTLVCCSITRTSHILQTAMFLTLFKSFSFLTIEAIDTLFAFSIVTQLYVVL